MVASSIWFTLGLVLILSGGVLLIPLVISGLLKKSKSRESLAALILILWALGYASWVIDGILGTFPKM